MGKLKKYWHGTPGHLRKLGVSIVGWLIVIAGIAMLVLPGPGWATIFVGFAILATEFASAKRTHRWLVARLKALINWMRRLLWRVDKPKR